MLRPYGDEPRRPLGHTPALPPPSAGQPPETQPQTKKPIAAPSATVASTVLYYQRKARATQPQARVAAQPARRKSETMLRWIARRFGLLVQLTVANTVLCALFGAGLMVFLGADLGTAARYAFGVWTVCLLPIALLWSHYISTRRIGDE